MGIPSVNATLPPINTLSSGNVTSSPPSLSTPSATGYSMADTFEAAPKGAGSYGSPSAGSSSPANAGGDFEQRLQLVSQVLDQVGTLLQEAGASLSGTGTSPGTGTPGSGVAGTGPVGLGNVTGDPGLKQAVQEIAQDPEGAKLVQAAQAQGLKLQVGDLPPGVMGQHLNGTITISPRAQQNRQDLIHTMAHELGHAATRPDGNSLNEEKTIDQLAQRIQQRIAPGPTFQLDVGSYRGLPQDNGIRNSLAQIGLQV